jgi:hypothetical protein
MRFFMQAAVVLILMSLNIGTSFARAVTLSEFMSAPANPMDFTITTKDSNSNSQIVIAEFGGTITLKSSSGASYVLAIPPRALLSNESITMTEVISMQNTEAGMTEPIHSILITPSGIEFKKPVSLTVSLPKPIALRSLVAFGTNANGQDGYLNPVRAVNSNSVELILNHFSTYTVTGSSTLREKFLKHANISMSHRLTSYLANQRFLQLFGDESETDFKPFVKEYVDEALKEYYGLDRMLNLIGLDIQEFINSNAYPVASSKTSHLCKQRAIEACYKDHRPFDIINYWLGVTRSNELLNRVDDPIEAELKELAYKCFNFELVIKSNISLKNPDGYSLDQELNGKIHLNADRSVGKVQVTHIDLKVPGLNCVQKSISNQEQETTMGLWMNDQRFDQSLGVTLAPLMPQGIAKYKCTDAQGKVFDMGSNYPWSIQFRSLHTQPRSNEFNSKLNQWQFYRWKVYYSEKFAERTWTNSLDNMTEKTTMTIYHLPVQ